MVWFYDLVKISHKVISQHNKYFLFSGVFEPRFLIVGTTIGLFLININTREVISTISFDHLYNNQIVEDILSAMVSTLMLSRSSYNGDINVLTQCMTDEKTAFFQVKFQSTIPLEDTGKSLSEALLFAEHGRTCCVQKLFWMSETISLHNMFSPGLSMGHSLHSTSDGKDYLVWWCL